MVNTISIALTRDMTEDQSAEDMNIYGAKGAANQ
jgi:hypothetical protein